MESADADRPRRPVLRTHFEVGSTLSMFYTGGRVAVLPSEDALACPCAEKIKIVDLETGDVRVSLAGDSEVITALAIHPSGLIAAGASRSLQLYVWDLETGAQKRVFRAHEGNVVTAMEFDSTGHYLCTGAADGTVRVWDSEGWYCTHQFKGHRAVITRILFHPDPHRYMVITGAEDGSLRCWDMVSKKSTSSELAGHDSAITGIAVSPCGWLLVSGSRDKTMNVWDLRKFLLLTSAPVYEAVESIRVLPSDMQIREKVGENRKPSFKSSKKGASCSAFEVLVVVYKDVIVLSAKHQIISVSAEHNIEVLDFLEEDPASQRFSLRKVLLGNMDELIDVCYIASSSYVAVATNSEHVKLLDLKTRNCQVLVGHTGIVLSLAVAVDGQLLASAGKDNTVRVWSLTKEDATGSMQSCSVAIGNGHTASIGAVSFSKKTKNFVASVAEDRTLKVWDLRPLAKHKIDNAPNELQLKAAATVIAHNGDINCVAVSPNDKFIATGSQDKTVKIWALSEGKAQSLTLAGTCTGHKRTIWSAAFSPVDLCLASSSGDQTIKIWSLTDFTCLKTLEGHTNSVLRCCFISSGMQILSTSSDTLVKLWNVKTSECVSTMDAHSDKIWALAVHANEEEFITGGSDSVMNIWADKTTAVAEEKTRNLEMNILQEQQLANFIRQKEFLKAAEIAFRLDRPLRLLGVLESLLAQSEGSLTEFLEQLSAAQVTKLLHYIRDWNTSARHATVAQMVLASILRLFPPEEILKSSNFTELLAGLIPYTERHLARALRLYRSSFLLDGTLSSMAILAPESTAEQASKKRKVRSGD
eukprot:tig00000704_g3346.t2